MDLSQLVTDAVTTMTGEVTGAFSAVGPVILLIGGGFIAWKYAKRFLGKI
jgi:hypothetical protein